MTKLDLTGVVSGRLHGRFPSVEGDWYGIVNYEIGYADGRRDQLHLVDQFVPFTTLREAGSSHLPPPSSEPVIVNTPDILVRGGHARQTPSRSAHAAAGNRGQAVSDAACHLMLPADLVGRRGSPVGECMMSKSSRARTRAVRQRMVESGVSYARAAREVGDPRQQSMPNRTDLVRVHIRALLSGQAQDMQQRDTEIEALEAQGHRIVGGGQTGPDSWEIHDWRTGEELAHGDDGLEGYDATADRLDPDGMWIHIDQIESEPGPLPVTAGIPESLSVALDDWISSLSTSDEEIAEFISWPVDKVRDHR